MSEIRTPLLGTTSVIIATDRAFRPDDFKPHVEPLVCPFCPGKEHLTPKPERLRYNGYGVAWELRVVPNKYPVAKIEGETRFLVHSDVAETISNMHGAHEVIIETPDHDEDLSVLPLSRLKNLFDAICVQTRDLYCDPKIRFIQVFKNHGAEGGASLRHPHTQLVGLPEIPEKIRNRLHMLENYKATRGAPMFEEELDSAFEDDLVVSRTSRFVCYCPYASRFPFEMVIGPLVSQSYFCEAAPHFSELAALMQEVVRRLKAVLGFLPDFNLDLDDMPAHHYLDCEKFYRWRWKIFPRLTKIAGFELGTGIHINPMPSEEAARLLREALI